MSTIYVTIFPLEQKCIRMQSGFMMHSFHHWLFEISVRLLLLSLSSLLSLSPPQSQEIYCPYLHGKQRRISCKLQTTSTQSIHLHAIPCVCCLSPMYRVLLFHLFLSFDFCSICYNSLHRCVFLISSDDCCFYSAYSLNRTKYNNNFQTKRMQAIYIIQKLFGKNRPENYRIKFEYILQHLVGEMCVCVLILAPSKIDIKIKSSLHEGKA